MPKEIKKLLKILLSQNNQISKAESEEEDVTSNQTELSETIKDSKTEDPDKEMSNVAAAAEGKQ